MAFFDEFNAINLLRYAIEDLKFHRLLRKKSFPIIMSGTYIKGMSQTGTGKTFAYMLLILLISTAKYYTV